MSAAWWGVTPVRHGLCAPAVPPEVRRVLAAVAAISTWCVAAIGVAVARRSTAFPLDDELLTAAGGWSPRLWPKALPIDFLGDPSGVVIVATVIVVTCLVLGRWRLAVLT